MEAVFLSEVTTPVVKIFAPQAKYYFLAIAIPAIIIPKVAIWEKRTDIKI